MKRNVFLFIGLAFLVIMFFLRFFLSETSKLHQWGSYLFIIPSLFCISIAIAPLRVGYWHIIIFTIGVVISILLFRGNIFDNLILLKIGATFIGALLSLIFHLWSQKQFI